jgi:hypothetical protein
MNADEQQSTSIKPQMNANEEWTGFARFTRLIIPTLPWLSNAAPITL